MSEQVLITLITAVVAPLILFVCQLIHERHKSKSQDIEAIVMRHHEEAMAEILENRRQTLRVELLLTLEQHPEDEKTILSLYDTYKSAGGNSFITEYISQWQRERAAARKKGAKK